MEVATREDVAALREDHGVVGGGVHLDRDRTVHVVQRVAHRPVDLGHATQAVGVLHLAAVPVGGAQGTALEQLPERPGGDGLAGMGAGSLDALVKGRVRALEGVEGQGPHHVGGSCETLRLDESEPRQRRHELRTVDERQALFRLEGHGDEARGLQRLVARQPPPLEDALALSHQRKRQVGEGGKVSACAD